MSEQPAVSASGPVLACRNVHKTFYQGREPVPVLLGVDLEVAPGERVAIVGASGSGKSTLLHILGGLDAPSAGEVRVTGRDIGRQTEVERGMLRPSVRLDKIREVMGGSEYTIAIDLGQGPGEDRMWTSDLTEEYVRINAKYTT